MDFTDKFIRYHPDITFEIFQLIWDKLLELNWAPSDEGNRADMFKEFKSEYKYLEQDDDENRFNVYDDVCRDDSFTEITIEEFLGYNPFTKSVPTTEIESPEYYEYTGDGSDFTNGKIYKIINPKNLEMPFNFIDDKERENGWSPNNHKHFNPSTKEAFDLQEQTKIVVTKISPEANPKEFRVEPIPINEFKKDDYIVTLKGNFTFTNCGKENYCFKQRIDKNSIEPIKDISGSNTNGNNYMRFDKSENLLDWRYATIEEIAEYDRLGKPYDVITLNKPIESLKKAVHCKTQKEIDFYREKANIDPIENKLFKRWGEIVYYLDTIVSFDTIKLITRKDYEIISFEDWCKQNNYVMEAKFEFKVGNWYKEKDGCYGKLMLKNRSYEYPNQFPALEYINLEGEYKTVGTYFQIDRMIQQEIDLSEIQQYLPDGHVDKIVEEIDLTGRYLKALIDSPQSTSYKKDDFVKIITKMSNYCYEIGDDKTIPWLYNTNNGIQHHWELMPIGFEPNKSTDFKVGDWVYFMGTDPDLVTSYWPIGTIGQIEEIIDSSYKFTIKGVLCGNRKDQFRLATQEEIQSVQPKPIQSIEFILPERWCIKFHKKVGEWLDKKLNTRTYYNSNYKYIYYPNRNGSHIFNEVNDDFTEITLDQFEKYVLNQENKLMAPTTTPVSSKQSAEDLLEEAKRRYPIGTKFKSPEDKKEYKVHLNYDAWIGTNGKDVLISVSERSREYVYFNDEWAEIIDEPNNESNYKISDCPFNEGDLISCYIHNTYIEGKIHFENNKIFICQNSRAGNTCKDKLGYNYSWMIYSTSSPLPFENQLISHSVENLQLLNESKSSDSLDDEYNEIFSGKGIVEQIESTSIKYYNKLTIESLEEFITKLDPIFIPKKTETTKIELLKTTKI